MRGKLRCRLCDRFLDFSVVDNIDFMGEGVTLFTLNCECGFQGTDVFPERIHEPRRLKLHVTPDRLNTLVAKSSTASISLPEIGVTVEAGPASQGFITTIEGLLVRIKDVLGEDVPKIDSLMSGEPFTLIIDDPAGTSAIDSPAVDVESE